MGKKVEYKKKLTIKFFTIVFGFLIIYILLSPIVFGFIITEDYNGQKVTYKEFYKNEKTENSEKNFILNNKFNIPKKTTFLVLGMDQSNLLADVCILGVFDRDTKNINLINIPRDTFVELSENTRSFILNNGRKIPKTTKISNLYSYSGKKIGVEVFKKYLKDEFDINIDYHLIMYIESFKKIVDILGPITMEIPKGGLYYNDPTQKLKIKVPEGLQKLDGKLAEGVVRYRASYKRGDLQRIEMQQKFIKELFKQTLSKKNLSCNIVPLITTIMKNIETNFKIEELPKYVPYLLKLKENNLIIETMPGTHKMIKDKYYGTNISYLICDKNETKKIIKNLFFETKDLYNEDEIEEYEIKENKIHEDKMQYNEIEENEIEENETEDNLLDYEYKIKIINKKYK